MATKTDVTVKLIGGDGNVFAIIGKVSDALKRAGYKDLSKEYQEAAFNAEDYNHVLRITMEYVEVE